MGQALAHFSQPVHFSSSICERYVEVTIILGKPCWLTPSIKVQQQLQQWHIKPTFFCTLSAVSTSLRSFERAIFSSISVLETSFAIPCRINASAVAPND